MNLVLATRQAQLEQNGAHSPFSLKPHLASIKARNCSSVSARDGSRSKLSQRVSSVALSASVTSCKPSSASLVVGKFIPVSSNLLLCSQSRSPIFFAL